MTVRRSEIEQIVLSELKTLLPRGAAIDWDDRLIADLELLSDDATAMGLGVQRRLGIRVDQSRWRTVNTVRDVVDALEEALEHRVSLPPIRPRLSILGRLLAGFRRRHS